MKILFCSSAPLSTELGASKVIIELAEEMERLGWKCHLIAPSDLLGDKRANARRDYAHALRKYLLKHAGDFDVVDYDHHHLPFPRQEFPDRTLLVARSVLLWHHFLNITLPEEDGFKRRLRSFVFAVKEARRRKRVDTSARMTVSEADLINVPNYDDHAALMEIGIPQERVVVIPYGINRANRELFDAVPSTPPRDPKVAFVGTFDNRKGATDFPRITQTVCDAVPGATFRLLGTAWDEKRVLASFPRRLRSAIEVVPRYETRQLAGLLEPCTVGVFPSYIEGFGLGVLEMLAASIPVVAYNSPGPPMMLPPEHLASRGDWRTLSNKVIELLTDQKRLLEARLWACGRSRHFCWQSIAKQTNETYMSRWQRLQANRASSFAGSR